MRSFFYKILSAWRHGGCREVFTRIVRKLSSIFRRTGAIAKAAQFELEKPIDYPTKLTISSQFDPEFSVLIYVSGDKIFNCLHHIEQNMAQFSSIEVMVMLDGKPPSSELLGIEGIQLLYSPHPLGAVASWNYLSKKAMGKYLIFINDYCQLTSQSIEFCQSLLEQGHSLGPKIISEHSQLLSAGVIAAPDGLIEFGSQDYPGEPEYNYLRPVEALSPFGFVILSNTFHQLDGFRREFASVSYAMADLCFRLRDRGEQVFYQPQYQLIYRDTALPGATETDRLAWQATWGKSKGPSHERRAIKSPTILVIDTLVPPYDKESGAFRLFQILLILLKQGYSVIFLPDYGHEQKPYTSELEALGIEVLYFTYQQHDWAKRLERRLSYIDIAWVCRPELVEKYFPILKQNPKIKLIYDTIDLHFIRLQREALINPTRPTQTNWQQMQEQEIKCARSADITLVVTQLEQQTLAELNIDRVWVIPNIHPIYNSKIPSHSDREGLLFIGGYYHSPNVDAVLWLCKEIMPLIWQIMPEINLTLLGSNPPAEVRKLAQIPRVAVPGYVQDVSSYFLNHRIFVAPLRFGAGMKGKIGHSLSFGLPVITTPIGAEGIGLEEGKNVLIADNPQTFAQTVIELYQNPELWQTLSQNSYQFIEQYSPQAIEPTIEALLKQFIPGMESY